MKRIIYCIIVVILILVVAVFACKKLKVNGICFEESYFLEEETLGWSYSGEPYYGYGRARFYKLTFVGNSDTLPLEIGPWYALNKKVTWWSSDTCVATVQKGIVTTKTVGTALIIVRTKDGKHWDDCTVKVIPHCVTEPEMVFVESGCFYQYAPLFVNGKLYHHEIHPKNSWFLKDTIAHNYQIAKFPVTQKLWKEIMGNNPSFFRGDDFPVESVSSYEVRDFIIRLNAVTGKKYYLPTMREWYYAALGGKFNKGYKFSGSDCINDVAWYNNNSNNTTHRVGGKKPNELDIYDMNGNVWEFVDYSALNAKVRSGGGGAFPRCGGGWNSIEIDGILCDPKIDWNIRNIGHNNFTGFRLAHP